MSAADLVKILQEENTDPRVKLIPFEIADIKVEERVRLKCMIPPCPSYGRGKFCPPNLPDLDFIRSALKGYQGGALVVLTIPYSEGVMEEVKRERPQNELMKLIGKFEKSACEKINHLAFGLTVGGCRLCEDCVSRDEPCRKPLEAHPGITGFGIDITTVARKLGVRVEWPVTTELNFMGMLFV
ncbi:DUF2284 domain-containing protein [Phosphitispora fastidiosa]|uniref:DUF2284 domain-containing protein n=1 Tax=Phosphitispora fastidiosa TaxID=2837202 RepID=UPI001E5F8D04|nr:DUF2284 domain-containing protein [Phosphitispora fastidiosa]MBU7007132.1 putative metal-binding protein [Phosphitispora fastidiosa]